MSSRDWSRVLDDMLLLWWVMGCDESWWLRIEDGLVVKVDGMRRGEEEKYGVG
jgi:hypothetical protein